MGIDGKSAIDPTQVQRIRKIFSPTRGETERVRKIVDMMEKDLTKGRNVATVNNKLVELPHLKEFRRILLRAGMTS